MKNKKYICKLVKKNKVGGYLCEVRKCCSQAIKKQKIKEKKEIEKFASHIQLVIKILLA